MLSFLLTASSVWLMAVPGFADVPHLIRYQGVLTDSAGQPVLDGDYAVTFRLYTDSEAPLPEGETCPDANSLCVWEEVYDQTTGLVPVTHGTFSVLLGSIEPLTSALFDYPDGVWLAIELAGESEMTPRQQITSVPFAVLAETAETLSGGTLTVVGGSVGIGTTEPVGSLEIRGPSPPGGASTEVRISTTATGGNETYLRFRQNDDSLFIGAESDVGNRLATGATPNAGVVVAGGDYPLHLGANQTVKMTITPSGDVGIGTTGPARTLDVAGTMKANVLAFPNNNSGVHDVISSATNTGVMHYGGVNALVIENGASRTLAANADGAHGLWVISGREGGGWAGTCVFVVSAGTVAELSDPGSLCSEIVGTASKLNVGFSAEALILDNHTGNNIQPAILQIGQ